MAAPPKAIDSEATRLAEAREALKSKHFDWETCVVSDRTIFCDNKIRFLKG